MPDAHDFLRADADERDAVALDEERAVRGVADLSCGHARLRRDFEHALAILGAAGHDGPCLRFAEEESRGVDVVRVSAEIDVTPGTRKSKRGIS